MLRGVEGPTKATLDLEDGIELVADVYRPSAPGPWPVLLMRQPYGRRIASTVTLAHPAWYAARGYMVVVQDVRGPGESGGTFEALAHEAADGAATLEWAADLPGSNSMVGLYGFSYQGVSQLLALAGATRAGGKRPDAIAPAMAAWSVRDHWAFEGGALRLAASQRWACQVAALMARRWEDPDAANTLAQSAAGEPWSGPVPGEPAVLEKHAPESHYWRWLQDEVDYWAAVSPDSALAFDPLDVPALFAGGWFDIMLEGTMAGYRAFGQRARLVVGPWLHIPWGTRSAGTGGEALAFDEVQAAFFDWTLKGRGEPGRPVRLFDLGTGTWQELDRLEDPAPTHWYLTSNGLAATTTIGGRLLREATGDGADILVHDPWRPAPAVGGHLGWPGGMADRAALDERTDVGVYTSEPLDRPMVLRGPVAAELAIEADRPAHDLHCALSLVRTDGAALTLTTGHHRVADAVVVEPRRVAMRHLACTLPAGSALRLSIQAAAFPAFAVNPGTGARPELSTWAAAEVTTLVIRHGTSSPSRLCLPVVH